MGSYPRFTVAVTIAALAWLGAGSARAQSGGSSSPSGQQPTSGDAQDAQKPPLSDPAVPPDSAPPKPAGAGVQAETDAEGKDATDEKAAAQETLPSDRVASEANESLYTGRSFSGLFNGAEPFGNSRHRLDLSGSVYGVQMLTGNVPIVGTDAPLQGNGKTAFAGASAGLTYGNSWGPGSFGAHASFSEAYMPDYKSIGDPWIDRWGVGATVSQGWTVGRRGRFGVSGATNYSPYLQQNDLFGSAPTVAPPIVGSPGLDFVVAREPSVWTSGGASFGYDFTRKSSFDVGYASNYRLFTKDEQKTQYDQLAQATYRYRFNRYVGLRAGYGYRRARYGFGPDVRPVGNHIIDAGLDGGYGRSYALSRRTTFSFNTGSSIYASDQVGGGQAQGPGLRPRVRIDASADLVHSWGRTWSSGLGYRRGVGYEIGFSQPILTDGAEASVGGLLAPRVDVTASANYTTGSVGFTGRSNGLNRASAVASIRGAITSQLAAYAQYFYYRYSYETGVALPFYLQSNLERQGVSVGLTAAVSLIRSRGRR